MTLFIAFLKALPQFLPFLLTLLKGEKANMSGHKDPSKGRVYLLLLVISLIGTGILYFDARSVEITLEGKTKELASLDKKVKGLNLTIEEMRDKGVPNPAQALKLQEQATTILELTAKRDYLITQLEQCAVTPPRETPPPQSPARNNLLDRLNKIGK